LWLRRDGTARLRTIGRWYQESFFGPNRFEFRRKMRHALPRVNVFDMALNPLAISRHQ
jgi:hypothetical protein